LPAAPGRETGSARRLGRGYERTGAARAAERVSSSRNPKRVAIVRK
jgi:hypothetical protein